MRKNSSPLTRQHILEVALEVLGKQGLAGLSMRKLAATLGVEAMSLYNHVKNKQDLLEGLANLILCQIDLPDEALHWEQRLETIALKLYETLVQYPDIAMILATEQAYPSAPKIMRGMDGMIAALAEAGLSPTQQVNAYRGLLALCFGFVFMHTVGMTRTREQAKVMWDQSSIEWDADTLPHLAQLSPYFKLTHANDDFRFVLRAYLNHLQAPG